MLEGLRKSIIPIMIGSYLCSNISYACEQKNTEYKEKSNLDGYTKKILEKETNQRYFFKQ